MSELINRRTLLAYINGIIAFLGSSSVAGMYIVYRPWAMTKVPSGTLTSASYLRCNTVRRDGLTRKLLIWPFGSSIGRDTTLHAQARQTFRSARLFPCCSIIHRAGHRQGCMYGSYSSERYSNIIGELCNLQCEACSSPPT